MVAGVFNVKYYYGPTLPSPSKHADFDRLLLECLKPKACEKQIVINRNHKLSSCKLNSSVSPAYRLLKADKTQVVLKLVKIKKNL